METLTVMCLFPVWQGVHGNADSGSVPSRDVAHGHQVHRDPRIQDGRCISPPGTEDEERERMGTEIN